MKCFILLYRCWRTSRYTLWNLENSNLSPSIFFTEQIVRKRHRRQAAAEDVLTTMYGCGCSR